MPKHVDHGNLETFEVNDLEKLIRQATNDLEEVDKLRREEFKEHELEKEFERRQNLEVGRAVADLALVGGELSLFVSSTWTRMLARRPSRSTSRTWRNESTTSASITPAVVTSSKRCGRNRTI